MILQYAQSIIVIGPDGGIKVRNRQKSLNPNLG